MAVSGDPGTKRLATLSVRRALYICATRVCSYGVDMIQKKCLIAIASVAILISVLACGNGDAAPNGGDPTDVLVVITTPTTEPTLITRRTATPTPAPTPTPLQVCAPNPDPAPPALLQIEEPKPEVQVRVPFHVRGWGSNIGFENRGVALAIVNGKQEVLQVLDLPPQPRTFRKAPDGLQITDNTRPFAADVVIQNIKEPTPFCIWVYLEADAAGKPKGVVQLPIIVVP